MEERWDRTTLVKRHEGRNVLPCMPLFSRLLRLAHQKPARIAIRDVRANIERTHIQLLSDVLTLRESIKETLGPEVVEFIRIGQEVYIAVLAAGGYEYSVAVLAVLALGAAVVPMATVLPVEEAEYFINKSQAALVLASSAAMELGLGLQDAITTTSNSSFKCIPIEPSLGIKYISSSDVLISSDRSLDDNAAGAVIFTSGTTGPPKGAVMRRSFTHEFATQVSEHYGLSNNDTILHCLPVHHATGIGIMFFPPLMAGTMIEFRSGGFDEVWMWERWREGVTNPDKHLTFFSGVPTIYMRMKRHFQQVISKYKPEILAEYVAGARQFRAMLCGTSALPQPINDFWTELLQKSILQRYGGTEFGAVFKVYLGDKDVPDGSAGEKVAGYDLKLSNGDEGEVLVRTPHMFSKYLRDPEATAKAHDEEGYFKTGDIARREGKYYFIIGRASLDIIKSGGYKLSALDIEREILALPYISEVIIVGITDLEYGQRVAAVLSLQEEEINCGFWAMHGNRRHVLTIEDLRRDLRKRVAGYKMPTLLRVVEGDLPKTASGKVLKRLLGEKYFGEGYAGDADVQVWRPPVKGEVLAKL
ncbi:putative AMP-binding enzyme [Tothia fuscella]|uniref:AMP-binding enzyme n=1 Tax=Tothia fuscella TaxID=1048955 RepID=A0A9P4U418_9PEZI|nr:putative AMP-binding enzyme [Tothia fuscella]